MLELKDITKHYPIGDSVVEALKGVSLSFRKNEFVSILGPSGCGKTTLLNIIGGLDRYTSGDILINGVSTKLYKDSDWDAYRNHSIGFVFQSYNLIPHQTVLSNVELALTLSGIEPKERKERATKALERVGLGDQCKKLPAQLSGGQMQRVAIARALVNDPEIILADEPTGALDTETSVQVMNLLKDISKDKLVIMVTHNPELAQEYSTRIINLKDGLVKDDSNPIQFTVKDRVSEHEKDQEVNVNKDGKRKKKPSMSFLTALSLSLKNLSTKKARTILTSFAGSIGIIGISLILSLSSGFSTYIDNVQRDTLSNYPLSITKTTMSVESFATSFLESNVGDLGEKFPEGDQIKPNQMIGGMLSSLSKTYGTNDLVSFKKYIDENSALFEDSDKISAISYAYNFKFDIYQAEGNAYRKVNYIGPMQNYMPDDMPPMVEAAFAQAYTPFKNMMESSGTWGELIGNNDLIKLQYDKLAGEWPTQEAVAEGEAWPLVLVVDQYNRIPDYALYMMGLLSDKEVRYIFAEMVYKMVDNLNETNEAQTKLDEQFGADFKPYSNPITFGTLIGKEYNILLSGDYYKGTPTAELDASGVPYNTYSRQGENSEWVKDRLDNHSVKVKISAIVRLKEGTAGGALSQSLYYTPAFSEYLIDRTQSLPIVSDQLKYNSEDNGSDGLAIFSTIPKGGVNWMVTADTNDSNHLSSVYSAIGMVDKNNPLNISIYPTSFENKDYVIQLINDYNRVQTEDAKKIQYTDYIGMMMSSITDIIDAITYVLIAFVSISLIVSSIMIGVITYISVLERTKEIGVLRAMGASKKDIARVFNAETVIIGFISGMLGIGVTILLNIPISLIIELLAGIPGVSALPVSGAITLVIISVLLTLIAGIIPSGMASKKDPVIALRSE